MKPKLGVVGHQTFRSTENRRHSSKLFRALSLQDYNAMTSQQYVCNSAGIGGYFCSWNPTFLCRQSFSSLTLYDIVIILLLDYVYIAWIKYEASRTLLRQLSNYHYNSVATRRERRANLQCLRTLLQATRRKRPVQLLRVFSLFAASTTCALTL